MSLKPFEVRVADLGRLFAAQLLGGQGGCQQLVAWRLDAAHVVLHGRSQRPL